VGAECARRAIVECERRFGGSKGEDPDDDIEITGTNRELMSALLDFRTLSGKYFGMAKMIHAKELLKAAYISFADTARLFEESKKPKVPSPAPAQAAAEEDEEHVEHEEEDFSAIWFEELEVATPAVATAPEVNWEEVHSGEFRRVFANWLRFAKSINWRKEFAEELKDKPTDGKLDALDLVSLNVGPLYLKLEGAFDKYGFLPVMARGSVASIGALPAESFCERCLSAGNLVMNKGNTLLPDGDVDMLVILRMNRHFMEYMRRRYPHLSMLDETKIFGDDE
jgi:hypothetical protein